MRMQRLWLAMSVLAVACGDETGPQEPGLSLSVEEAADVAAELGDLAYADMDSEMSVALAAVSPSAPSDTTTMTRTFDRARRCPHGGEVAVAGTTVAVIDRETMHVVVDTDATRTHQDCVVPMRRAGRRIELNGAPNVAMDAHFERQAGMPVGAQTVSLSGAIDWAVVDSDRAGTCEIALDIAWERTQEGGWKTVDGVVCGREVHSETTWNVDGEG